jgi:hypothetical protein
MAKAKESEPALAERLTQARADAEAFIDGRAAEMKKECPTLPIGVLRQQLTARAFGCSCRAALNILKPK